MKIKILSSLCLLTLVFCSCNSSDEVDDPSGGAEMQFGKIDGVVIQLNEYGLFPFDLVEPSKVLLKNAAQELVDSITTEGSYQDFTFENLAIGTYFLHAESPTYKSCNVLEIELSEDDLEVEAEISLKSMDFSAKLNAVQVDSLNGNKLYHSFDIEKDGGKTIGVRFYLSDQANVDNQNYLETVMNLSSWASANSGQFYSYLEIDPELYAGDSIYTSVYLVNYQADECLGDNGLMYHFPYSEEYLTIGFEK